MERIKAIYSRQKFEYPFPNLSDPVFAMNAVEEENGEVQAAAFLKLTAEAYLFIDPFGGTPRGRWQSLLRTHDGIRQQAADAGLSEVTCWIPPNLGKAFHRRLTKLGWQMEPSDWQRAAYHLRSVTEKITE